MKYFNEMLSKFGFSDGDGEPFGVQARGQTPHPQPTKRKRERTCNNFCPYSERRGGHPPR